MKIPLGTEVSQRFYAKQAEIGLTNRFFETNPTDEDGFSLLSRPGTTLETIVGNGPIQANYTVPGLFSSDLFTISGGALYRRSTAGVNTLINGSIGATTRPRMAGVAGAGYQRVFITNGSTLQYYGGAAYDGTLTFTPGAVSDDVINIDGVYYVFSNVVNLTAGAGTATNPYYVNRGASAADALLNLRRAINANGTASTDYSSGVVRNPRVIGNGNTATTVTARSRVAGLPSPSINTSVILGTTAQLTLTPGTIADDVVQVDGVYYQFVASVAAGDGTVGNPYKVVVGGSNAQAFINLAAAINAIGVAGITYSSGLVQNARMRAYDVTGLSIRVMQRNLAVAFGATANLTVTPTGGADGLAWSVASVPGAADGFAWGAATLTVGPEVLYGVATPDDVGVSDVAVLRSYVLVLQVNSQRVYYILPGETEIDPLNFFEAESSPDQVNSLVAVGDQVWLIGDGSTEPWYATGASDAPFRPIQGRPFARGGIAGTAVVIQNSVILVGNDNMVYRIEGGATPISTNAIAERVRVAREIEKANP